MEGVNLWMAPVEDTDAEELKARFEEFGFEVELLLRQDRISRALIIYIYVCVQ